MFTSVKTVAHSSLGGGKWFNPPSEDKWLVVPACTMIHASNRRVLQEDEESKSCLYNTQS